MALVLADRVRETTITTGQGSVSLAGAVPGYQTFSVIGNTNTTYYCIAGQGTSEWEVGIGTYTSSGASLSRDTVLASSAGAPTKTNFSAGVKDVFVTYPAERSVYANENDTTVTVPSLTTGGNVNFTGTGNRITGDFSNATFANRVMFQTSTANSGTHLSVIPNGTAAASFIRAYNNSDPTNAGAMQIDVSATESSVRASISGTGTYLPMTFYTSGSEKLRIAADLTGTYTFGGTAPRITGDFSNATVANRVAFQTSTTNGNTGVFIVPNGTGTNSNIQVISASDPTNSSTGTFQAVGGSDIRIQSGIHGTGTYLPMTFFTGGSEKMRILTSTTPSAVLGSTNVLEGYGRSTFSVVHASGGLVEVGTSGGGRGIMYWDEAGNSLILNGRSTNSSVGLQSVGTGAVTVTTNSLERMRIDSAGNVGIGTNSPTFRLDVRGAAAAAGIYAQVVNTDATAGSVGGFIGTASGTSNFFVLAQSVGGTTTLTNSGANALIVQTAQAQPLIFATNGTERMRIDSNGAAAIGGSVASGFRLNLTNNNLGTTAGDVKHSLQLSTTTSNGDFLLCSKYRISNGSDWTTAGWRIQQLVDATYHAYIQFNGNNNEGISFGTGGSANPLTVTERMNITSAGNVGIGTSSPTQLLDVNGNVAITGSARRITGDFSNTTVANRVMFQTSTVNGVTQLHAIPNGTIGSGASASIVNVEDSNSVSTGNGSVGSIANIQDTRIQITSGIRGTGTYLPMTFFTGGSERMRIDSSGNVGIGTSSPATRLHVDGTIRYTNRPAAGTITAIGFDTNGDLKASSSSLRYKHDIEDYDKGLAEVMQLRPVSFKFNGEENTNIGFIAEEVDALGLTEVMLYNEEEQPEGVIYANMVSLLTKAIQELKAELDSVKAELTILKGN